MVSQLRKQYKCICYGFMICSEILSWQIWKSTSLPISKQRTHCITLLFTLETQVHLLIATYPCTSTVLPWWNVLGLREATLTEQQFQEALHPVKDSVIPKENEEEGNMRKIFLQFQEPTFHTESSHLNMLRYNHFFCDLSKSAHFLFLWLFKILVQLNKFIASKQT